MWNINQSTAQLTSDLLSGAIELTRPWMGLTTPRYAEKRVLDRILGAWTSEQQPAIGVDQVDAYVRGPDLIACYSEGPDREIRLELYWRYSETAACGLAGLELVASVQTSSLNGLPRLKVESRLAVGEALEIEATEKGRPAKLDIQSLRCCHLHQAGNFLLVRPRNSAVSYAEMAHPTDFVRSEIRLAETRDELQLCHDLFPNVLEKGVIRRGRVRGVLLPREQDVELAQTHFREFAASKPMLST